MQKKSCFFHARELRFFRLKGIVFVSGLIYSTLFFHIVRFGVDVNLINFSGLGGLPPVSKPFGFPGEKMGENQAQRKTEKGLLNITELCEYLGIGQTKARELLRDPANGFTVRIGNRLYAHKGKLDIWLENQTL